MSKNDDRITVGKPIPKVAAVEAGSGLSVRVTWKDGRTDVIDLTPIITGFKVFRPLRNDRGLFAQVEVDEFGSGIVWPGDMDLSNYTLEQAAEVSRQMQAEEFKAWLKRVHLTLDSAPAAIGVSRRQLAYFSSGKKPIDQKTKLACIGYATLMGEKVGAD